MIISAEAVLPELSCGRCQDFETLSIQTRLRDLSKAEQVGKGD